MHVVIILLLLCSQLFICLITCFHNILCLLSVSDGEFTRLKDAYKRTATLNGAITKQAFIREVLGDGVPLQLAEVHYKDPSSVEAPK